MPKNAPEQLTASVVGAALEAVVNRLIDARIGAFLKAMGGQRG